jgi:hypothetical protein
MKLVHAVSVLSCQQAMQFVPAESKVSLGLNLPGERLGDQR